MADMQDDGAISARILYWGVEGAGKSTNLSVIYQRLRPDNRGELESHGTRLDPTVTYEVLPIELGQLSGKRTRIQITAVPGAREHAPTRKQLLDQVEGIVFVVDAQRERIDENLASFEELRSSLGAYGRSLDDLPLVIQYNKSDLSDPYALEELHRKLETRGAAAFEATAQDGIAVLDTLTTISKRVIRSLREREAAAAAATAVTSAVPETPTHAALPKANTATAPLDVTEAHPMPLATAIQEQAGDPGAERAAETAFAAQALLEPAFDEIREEALDVDPAELASLESDLGAAHTSRFELAQAGPAVPAADGTVRVPLRLRDAAGNEVALALTLRLEADDD